ncbi:MAG: monovalent cation:proton antiporter-2 (CPA2) family protein [Bdellovibrionaceae bacterium]|nr:monovalent cation:proton antiporter-2 (CPA2) family protein [Pseudobdellovibrionaceae bacterium]
MLSYVEQALVFIGASIVLVPIFRRLGLGSILGYLVAGVIVGPHGLKLFQDSQSTLHFAELGIILLLFVIGLEIQPHKLWSMRRHMFGLGGLQVVATSAVFAWLGIAAGFSSLTSLVLGFGLSLSSTAFSLQALTERNEFNTEFGRSSFAILLMQDLAAIPALALIPALGVVAVERGPNAMSLVYGLAIVVFLVLASRFLIRPVFRIIAETRTRELFTAVTLFVVLGVAALMQKAGLSAALGTFIAGMLLAESEYRHEIEADLEPFEGLLMGLFFIAVGMGIRVDLIVSRPSLVLGIALVYFAIKAMMIYGAGRVFRMSHESSRRMALTIAQGGEFAFVIFYISAQGRLASEETLSLLNVVIAISMIINSLVLVMNDHLARSLRRKGATDRPYDEIQGTAPEVIIAGFGRFGQMFGRILRAQGIPFVAIDHSPDQIDLMRHLGHEVYYGDASRHDLLEKAGAGQAKYFVLAIDDVEASLSTAKVVKKNFPHLQVFARARNRGHAFELMELEIRAIKRETFDSSVEFVRDLLVEMGRDRDKATEQIERFKRHDELMLREQYKVRSDDKMFVSVSAQGTVQLAQVLREDSTQSYVDLPSK